ncbi:hypothetical protein LZC95_26300 [Pendulispora brunnea]|uniref:Uncharacterized protein n=1 Tax=Pendulispora brunnea TaxID=2905690 RepID=A0ABZ2JU47_9BACT
MAEEPLILSPVHDAGAEDAAASTPAGPSEVSQPTASECPRGRSVPFGFDLVPDKKLRPEMRQGVPVLETVRFAISNLVGVPRQVEVLEIDQLGATRSGPQSGAWDVARPIGIRQAYFEGGTWGPPGMMLVLPAHAVTTVIVELNTMRFYLPNPGIRVHVRVDGRRACFDQPLQVGGTLH